MRWVICPKCQSAVVGSVGSKCSICHVKMVATPLFPEPMLPLLAELGVEYPEYTDEEQAILDEFGLE